MTDLAVLLPSNATGAERALEQATGYGSRLPEPLRPLWNPGTCPTALLPWLAWALSVDEWDAKWSDDTKRACIRAAVGIHRRKGTRGAAVAALSAAGYPDAILTESFAVNRYSGAQTHNGGIMYIAADHWAEYRVQLARPITIQQADQVRAILRQIAPARCHLKLLEFQAVAHLYDRAIRYDGQFSYGAA